MAKVVLPRVHVMLVCDEVEPVPEEQEVFNLFGVRKHIEAPSFPHVHPRLMVYLQMTGHAGTVTGVVVIVNARTDEEVIRAQTPAVVLRDPLSIVPVYVLIEDCEFPEPGVYYFQVYFGQKLISERLFYLTEGQGATNGRQGT